jgi:hypothetical protein
MAVSKLQKVPVREAFPHEAHRFTVWLETNIDALSEGIGLQLSVLEREKAVGSFSVDLLCEDRNGDRVIIENQLERSDHDHLGKLLTYLVNLDAKTAIWVTPDVRPEHERVIDWLNETTGADYAFYLVQVEAVRIADSPYAPLFTVLAAPDEQIREIGEVKGELAEREKRYQAFWSTLIERSRGKTHLFANIAPNTLNWISTSAGRTGYGFNYVFAKDAVQVELYIDPGSPQQNKAIFDALYEDGEAIEAEFGAPLDWQRLDNRRACRIRYVVGEQDALDHPEGWPDLQEALIDAMIRLDRTFRQRIAKLKA